MPVLRPLLASLTFIATLASAQTGEEVPFITSPDNVTLEMLRMANVGPRDHVIDLGSGDGRIVILAARRFGATGLGVEIVPDLVKQSLRNAQDAGVASRVDFRVQDLFQTDLSKASVITMYLLPEVNLQLRPALLALQPGTRVVSHDWDMGEWQPDRTTTVPVPDKAVGLEKFSRIHLWVVPARIGGLWCARGSERASLDLSQKYQQVEGRVARGSAPQPLAGRIDGRVLRIGAAGAVQTVLEADGDSLRVTGRGDLDVREGAEFVRAQDGRC